MGESGDFSQVLVEDYFEALDSKASAQNSDDYDGDEENDIRSAETNNSIDGVISELSQLIKLPGNEDEVNRIIKSKGKDFFTQFAAANSFNTSNNSNNMGPSQSFVTSSSFNDSVDIAVYCKDKDSACIVLAGYTGSVLNEENIHLILAIQKQYSVEILIQILKQWLDLGEIFMLMPFIANFLKAGGAKAAVFYMIKHKIKTFTEYVNTSFLYSNDRFLDVFKACNEVGDMKSQEFFAKHISSTNCRTKSELVDIFLILRRLNSIGFAPLRLVLTELIKTEIEQTQSQGLWFSNDNDKYHNFCSCKKCLCVADFMKTNHPSLTLRGCNDIQHMQEKFFNRPLTISKQGRGKGAVIMIEKKWSIYQMNEQKLEELSKLQTKLMEHAGCKRKLVNKKDDVLAKKKKEKSTTHSAIMFNNIVADNSHRAFNLIKKAFELHFIQGPAFKNLVGWFIS